MPSEVTRRLVLRLEAARYLGEKLTPVVTVDGIRVEHLGVEVEIAEGGQFAQQLRAARRRLAQVVLASRPGANASSSSMSASSDHHSSLCSAWSLAVRQ